MQVGKYKSYGEPYTRTSMSPAFREEVTDLLHDTSLLAEAVADAGDTRSTPPRELVDNGPYTPKEALKAGLIGRVGYEKTTPVDAVKSDIHEKSGQGSTEVRQAEGRHRLLRPGRAS